MKRMDRYENTPRVRQTRENINKDLYQNTSNNAIYTNLSEVTNANAFEIINNKTEHKTREAFQNMKKYQGIESVPKTKKELDEFNYLYQNDKRKIYDINSVLEEARKNRQDQDTLEEKRKLKNASYNILTSLDKDELEKYREEKKKRVITPEEEEIREIIDTIASKTLAGEIDKETTVDLLSDLMATNILDRVDGEETEEEKELTKEIEKEVTEEISKVVLNAKELEKMSAEENIATSDKKISEADTEFYSKSMDLNKDDLEMDDEFVEKKLPLPIKIIIFILIFIITVIAGYFILQRLH